MSTPDPTALLELAVEVARAAGDQLLTDADRLAAGADLGQTTKSTLTDAVSDADVASERLITSRILAVRPDDGVLGEEGQAQRAGTTGLRWVVDPLDGTVNFLYGQPTWVVTIAVEDADGALVGVVHHPPTGDTYTAVRGGGAHCGERVLQVTTESDLDRTLVSTGFAYDVDVRRDWAAEVATLLPVVRDVRRGGAAALDLAWTAAGRHDAYLEFALHPWDWSAGGLLVQEAGGRVVDLRRRLGGAEQAGMLAGGPAAVASLAAWLERDR